MTAVIRPAPSVTIAVCTFRRAHVADTLRSLATLAVPQGWRADIVVADNDDAPSARALVEAAGAGLPFPLRYVHAPAGNISIARNACLDHANGDFLAFIDDDEIVSANWLAALLGEAERSGADAVLGPVRAVYGETAPSWMKRGDFHSTLPVFVKGRILTGYTCNVLLDRRSRVFESLRFDPARGRSGGEDTAFFHEVVRRGGSIAFCSEAEVSEAVPVARASMGWLARRRFRMGQTHGQLLATGRGPAGRLTPAAIAGAKLVACLALALRHAVDPVAARRNVLRAALHAGAVAGVLGARSADLYGAPSRESAGPHAA